MATTYTSCVNCRTPNPGSNARCVNCGSILPAPMPLATQWNGGTVASEFPGKLQAISIIQTVVGVLEIIGGIFGGIYVIVVGLLTFGIGLLFIPLPLIILIIGILSLISGIRGLNKNLGRKMSLGVGIAQMTLLLLCDVLSFGAGLTAVILLTQDDTKAYFNRTGQ